MTIILLALLFLIMPGSGYSQCSTTNTTFQKNKRILLDLLSKNAPLHDGFYNATVGNNSDQLYGVSQCKANISSNLCAKCLNSSMSDFNGCPLFTEVESVFSLCTTKISNRNIVGVWTNSSMATYGNEGLDDPYAFSKGFSMMQNLASTAPYQPLMFQEAEVDVGVYGKRYGLAQCGRDLSTLNCQNCFEDGLLRYRSFVKNRTGWEILGSSCSMWYSNVSGYYMTQYGSVSGVNISISPPPPSRPPPPPPHVDSQFPHGKNSVTSGCRRCSGGIGTGTDIWIINFIVLLCLATQVFYIS